MTGSEPGAAHLAAMFIPDQPTRSSWFACHAACRDNLSSTDIRSTPSSTSLSSCTMKPRQPWTLTPSPAPHDVLACWDMPSRCLPLAAKSEIRVTSFLHQYHYTIELLSMIMLHHNTNDVPFVLIMLNDNVLFDCSWRVKGTGCAPYLGKLPRKLLWKACCARFRTSGPV